MAKPIAQRQSRNPWVGFFGSLVTIGAVYTCLGLADDHSNQTWVGAGALLVGALFGVLAVRRRRSLRRLPY